MEEIERAQERLDHVRTVQPIIGALRTISLGSWQATLNRRGNVEQYRRRLTALLPIVAPHLPRPNRRARKTVHETARRSVVLIVGSERGLVGRFNSAVIRRAEAHIDEQQAAGVELELAVLGSRAERILRQRGRSPNWARPLSITSLPPYDLALEMTREWMRRFEQIEVDAVDLIHNAYQGLGRYETTVCRLIPPQMPPQDLTGDLWPPPIIETDALSLYVRIVEQWAAVSLYDLLLDSAAAEHSTRYQLMDSATQNIERLIERLTQAIQAARRDAITREMQELAIGAGLIGTRD